MADQRSVIEGAIRGMLGLSEASTASYTKATERAKARTEKIQEESMPGFGDEGFSEGAAAVGQRISQGGGKKEKDDKDDKRKWWKKNPNKNVSDPSEITFGKGTGQIEVEQSG